jgi:putative ABC transport system substrate-binding protein
VLGLGLLWATPSLAGQQAKAVPRIGYLGLGSAGGNPESLDGLRQGLRDLGYVEGQNIAIEYRWAEGNLGRLPALAAELVRLKVDLIVAPATRAIQAAKEATHTIPIVMTNSRDPVGTGVVAGLARPGGNITGMSMMTPDVSAKRLQLLKEVVPRASRVAILWNPDYLDKALQESQWEENRSAARALGLSLQSRAVRALDDLDGAFASMTRERADALAVLTDPLTLTYRKQIAAGAARHRLPAMYEVRQYVDAGGLMAYGASLFELNRRAAAFVDKILKGAKPAGLPVEQPTQFELVVNLKAAKALGITIPVSILVRADQVIQ